MNLPHNPPSMCPVCGGYTYKAPQVMNPKKCTCKDRMTSDAKIKNEGIRESGELFCQFNYDYKSCDKIKMFKCKYCELNKAK